jgi:hypothetical protein
MSTPPSLHDEIVAARGLPTDATRFLQGRTLDEIEQSADELARLLATSGGREQERPRPLADLFGGAPAKAARQRALVALFSGRVPQPRDEHGRFATKPVASFDGGARESVLPVSEPGQEHNAFLGRILVAAQAHRCDASF